MMWIRSFALSTAIGAGYAAVTALVLLALDAFIGDAAFLLKEVALAISLVLPLLAIRGLLVRIVGIRSAQALGWFDCLARGGVLNGVVFVLFLAWHFTVGNSYLVAYSFVDIDFGYAAVLIYYAATYDFAFSRVCPAGAECLEVEA